MTQQLRCQGLPRHSAGLSGGTHRHGAEWRRDTQLRAQKMQPAAWCDGGKAQAAGIARGLCKGTVLARTPRRKSSGSDAIQRGEVLVMLNLHKTFTSVLV